MAKQNIFVGEVYHTKRFGPLRIAEYHHSNNVVVEFINTGYRVKTHTGAIKKGQVRDVMVPTVEGVGCIGDGSFPATLWDPIAKKSTKHPVYAIWAAMLQRCYNRKSHINHPTYIGCEVCPEWRNYQHFFLSVRSVPGFDKWCESHLGLTDVRYALDKDKLVPGNRVYSPQTCCFISIEENALLALVSKLTKIQQAQ